MTTPDYFEDAPHRQTGKKRPLRTTILVLLGVVLAIAAVVAGFLVSLAVAFESKTTTIEDAFPDASTRPERTAAADGAMNILLMGSDARAGEAAGDSGEVPEDARSDTMMLVHIPEERENIYVMSIMRDTWTEIPNHGAGKVNSAMALGGVPLVVQTVEAMFDAPVDHVVMLDFEGFKGLTDALGGVTVDNPIAFRSEGTEGESFQQGMVTLDGESALKFVRERKAFTDGDYQRVQNQQLFIKGVMSELLSAETFTNPARLSRVVNEISPYLSVDEEFGAMTLGSLALGLWQVRSDDVVFFTLPNLGVGTSPDGQSIVVKDEEAIGRIAEALDEGRLGEFVESHAAGG